MYGERAQGPFDYWQALLLTHGLEPARWGDESTSRAASGGGLVTRLRGVSLDDLLDDYGSPLVLVDETASRARVESFREFAHRLGRSLTPRWRISAGGKTSWLPQISTTAPVQAFATVASHPTRELLRLLAEWGIGLTVQCRGELERALRVGANPGSILYSSSFKALSDISVAYESGCLALEVESLAEFEFLCGSEVRALAKEAPLRLCLRMRSPVADASHAPFEALDINQCRYVCSRVLHEPHLDVVGLSACWAEGQLPTLEEALPLLGLMRELALEQISAGVSVEFVMVGVRHSLGFGESTCEKSSAEVFRLTQSIFRGAPFRLLFSCADAVFREGSHALGTCLARAPYQGRMGLYTDFTVPAGISSPGLDIAPLSLRTGVGLAALGNPRGAVPLGFEQGPWPVLARRALDHRPVSLGHLEFLAWPASPQVQAPRVLLARGGQLIAAAGSRSCSVPRPAEVLLRADGEVVVLRVRDDMEMLLSGEL